MGDEGKMKLHTCLTLDYVSTHPSIIDDLVPDVIGLLSLASAFVRKTLFLHRCPPCLCKNFIQLKVCSFDGVAYTTHSGRSAKISLSRTYVEDYAERARAEAGDWKQRTRNEIEGVIYHEMTHCYQPTRTEVEEIEALEKAEGIRVECTRAPEIGTTIPQATQDPLGPPNLDYEPKGERVPGWLIEGVADWVRILAGVPAAHWKRRRNPKSNYDDAYATTAFFLSWLDSVDIKCHADGGTGMKCLSEEILSNGWTDRCLMRAFGLRDKNVENMWHFYQECLPD